MSKFDLDKAKATVEEHYAATDWYDPTERAEVVANLTKVNNINDLFRFCRDMSWDLWTALGTFAKFAPGVDQDIENGSCQNTNHRQVGQYIVLHGLELECLYDWDT
jgi:hypothetical protein